jgi:predicted metal-dependent peptidase
VTQPQPQPQPQPSKMLQLIAANKDKPVTEEERAEVFARVSRMRTRLTEAIPFFGHMLLKLKPVVTRQVPVAAVTQRREMLLNPDWVLGSPHPALATAMVHEMLHCALLFWDRMAGRTVMACGPDLQPVLLWNLAHDYAINLIIETMGKESERPEDILSVTKMDPPGLFDEKYKDWSAEEVYEDLLANLKPLPPHLQKMLGGMVYCPGADGSKGDVKDGGAEGEGEDKDGQGGMSESEKKENDQFWKVSLVEAAQIHEQDRKNKNRRGTLPGSLKKLIDEIVDPRVPWIDVLSRWVGEHGKKGDFSWRRPARRSDSAGEYLPCMVKHGCADVVVLWDSSGSMWGRENEIMSEVVGIVQDLGLSLRVICCDAAVQSDQTNVESPEDVHWAGGGGSNFNPAFDLLEEEQYEGVLVVFTDGAIGVPAVKPETIREVLWCIWPSEKHDRAPTDKWGEVIVVDEDGFIKKTGKE